MGAKSAPPLVASPVAFLFSFFVLIYVEFELSESIFAQIFGDFTVHDSKNYSIIFLIRTPFYAVAEESLIRLAELPPRK